MTVMFFLPILGYRSIVLSAKREWSARIDDLMSQAGVLEVPHSIDVEDPVAFRILYLLVLSTQVRQIKDWHRMTHDPKFQIVIKIILEIKACETQRAGDG
jgi:hypothetical protein